MTKRKAMSVYIDDETALALNRIREDVRQKNTEAGMPALVPTIGWLARTFLREKLGLVDGKAAKQDAPGSV